VNYPRIANSGALATIAGNIDARFEISIDASRAEQFASDTAYPLQFVITAEGADRAIVIGDANVTNAWIGYQCGIEEQYVINDYPDVIRARETNNTLSNDGNFECRPKPCRITEWYVRVNPDQRTRVAEIIGRPLSGSALYEAVTTTQRNAIRLEFPGGRFDYVKECL
jgi:hypothetical protein